MVLSALLHSDVFEMETPINVYLTCQSQQNECILSFILTMIFRYLLNTFKKFTQIVCGNDKGKLNKNCCTQHGYEINVYKTLWHLKDSEWWINIEIWIRGQLHVDRFVCADFSFQWIIDSMVCLTVTYTLRERKREIPKSKPTGKSNDLSFNLQILWAK